MGSDPFLILVSIVIGKGLEFISHTRAKSCLSVQIAYIISTLRSTVGMPSKETNL